MSRHQEVTLPATSDFVTVDFHDMDDERVYAVRRYTKPGWVKLVATGPTEGVAQHRSKPDAQ